MRGEGWIALAEAAVEVSFKESRGKLNEAAIKGGGNVSPRVGMRSVRNDVFFCVRA